MILDDMKAKILRGEYPVAVNCLLNVNFRILQCKPHSGKRSVKSSF